MLCELRLIYALAPTHGTVLSALWPTVRKVGERERARAACLIDLPLDGARKTTENASLELFSHCKCNLHVYCMCMLCVCCVYCLCIVFALCLPVCVCVCVFCVLCVTFAILTCCCSCCLSETLPGVAAFVTGDKQTGAWGEGRGMGNTETTTVVWILCK